MKNAKRGVKIAIMVLVICAIVLCACIAVIAPSFLFITNEKEISDEYYPKSVYCPADLDEPLLAVDLSYWNDEVNFDILAENGVKAVILRLSRYNMDLDERFDEYYKKAKEHEMLVGCYYFMHALSNEDALKDVDKIIGLLNKGNYVLDLPVFYDVEDEHDEGPEISEMGKDELTEIMLTFLESMRARGVYAGYYSSLSYAKYSYWPDMLVDYPFWGAAWTREVKREEFPNLCIWQYSPSGEFPMHECNFDMNKIFVDFREFIERNDLIHEEGIYG